MKFAWKKDVGSVGSWFGIHEADVEAQFGARVRSVDVLEGWIWVVTLNGTIIWSGEAESRDSAFMMCDNAMEISHRLRVVESQ